MDEFADLSDEELEALLRERAQALDADLVLERTEEGDWLASLRRDGTVLASAETALVRDGLIGLLDDLGS